MTQVKRIDLSQVADLESTIKAVCEIMDTDNYKLAATFVFQSQLVMIFQQ